MAEEEAEEKQSESPLFSDYERISALLNDAQNLSKQNRNYNPATFRDYFVVLADIQRFFYPLFGGGESMKTIEEDVKALDKITRSAWRRLLTEKDYKVPSQIFDALSDLHTDLMILKQKANLGIKVRERLIPRKKLERALE